MPKGGVMQGSNAAEQRMRNPQNPPFDINGEYTAGAGVPKFVGSMIRGYIEQADETLTQKYRTNFLYNPSVINASYELTTDIHAPDDQSAAEQSAQFYATGRGVGFDLLFDRRIEVWRAKNGRSYGHDFRHKGVYVDIQHLERTLGISQEGQPLLLSMVKIWVMGAVSIQGHVQSMDIGYAMFTNKMVPTVAVVNLQILQSFVNPIDTTDPAPGVDGGWGSDGNLPEGFDNGQAARAKGNDSTNPNAAHPLPPTPNPTLPGNPAPPPSLEQPTWTGRLGGDWADINKERVPEGSPRIVWEWNDAIGWIYAPVYDVGGGTGAGGNAPRLI